MPTGIIGRSNSNHIFFSQGEAPYRDNKGHLVITHSPDIPFEYSAALWAMINLEMNEALNRKNFQIVMLNINPNDLSQELYKQYQKSPSGLYAPAYIWDQKHDDGEVEYYTENEAADAEHIYLVGPLEYPIDYIRALTSADHFKERLNAKVVTLVATSLGSNRSDKNVDSKGNYVPKGITIETMMELLAGKMDRIIALEPHSSLAQYYSETYRTPFLPLSPWESLITQMCLKEGFASMTRKGKLFINPEEVIVVGPDAGRNWAAKKIAEYYSLAYVSGEKKRVNDGEVIIVFKPEDIELIKKRDKAFGYDDEIATGGTGKILGRALRSCGINNFYLAGVHAKLVGNWQENIGDPSLTRLYLTNSRKPIGKIQGEISEKIHLVSIAPLIADLIESDVKGIDFWHDPKYSGMILQQK
ncbi:MAG: hypothetical protein US60_C0013G0016 [Microgenomates group bacterium GW2011_GWC1_37_8]|uniref:Uncharacterized protein n=1 Tax=Candidatus Woesebacteria bacterium GW2011_GWB1_38_8 TaxID=1618570 RepID=A0A0G0L001_9BACT|nr:MAG: hypothetical protein US60_C0013G0016 [Microgenomates group bacterium GW2011_GWC1_37_8]KKQ84327.1 MAG: hypothetical protein UT08_C0019G0021 [Candidatus Woesebacteria bacterium GW2011_GWB1_38_8]